MVCSQEPTKLTAAVARSIHNPVKPQVYSCYLEHCQQSNTKLWIIAEAHQAYFFFLPSKLYPTSPIVADSLAVWGLPKIEFKQFSDPNSDRELTSTRYSPDR